MITISVVVGCAALALPLFVSLWRRVRTRRAIDNLGPVSERWLLGHRAEDQ